MYRPARSRWLSSPPVNPFAQEKRRLWHMRKTLKNSMNQSISVLQKTLPPPPPFPFGTGQPPYTKQH